MNIQQMMKQAQQMQEKMQQQMAEMRIEATSGGGMVTVVVDGTKQVHSVKIDPEAVSKDDVEMLQEDRKSTRLNSKSRLHLVCRLLLEKKNVVELSSVNHDPSSGAPRQA